MIYRIVAILCLLAPISISENTTEHITQTVVEDKDFNFVVTNRISSLDIHFVFQPPQPPTIRQPEVTTTAPAITTYHPTTLPPTTTTVKSSADRPVTTFSHDKPPEHNSTIETQFNSTADLPHVNIKPTETPAFNSTVEHQHVEAPTSVYPHIHDLPPKPTITAPITSRNSTLFADSPIGYEVQCGIRGAREIDDRRIVNGTNAETGEFPWLVSIQLKSGLSWRHICGGTIISRSFVITAGHCIYQLPVTSLSVVAGDYNLYVHEGHEERSDVVRITGLKGFMRDTFTEDIALVQLEPYLRMDGIWVAPICLPQPHRQFTSGRGIVAGWGRLSEGGSLPQVLQRVSLPIMDKERCIENYAQSGFSSFLHTCQICSGWEEGGSDSCQGDSGGPLACEGEDGRLYLCGVVSWGIGCARPKHPGVYTQVSCYSQWIAGVLYNRPTAISQSIDLQ